MKLLSWNVAHRKCWRARVDAIASRTPDLIALHEITGRTEGDFMRLRLFIALMILTTWTLAQAPKDEFMGVQFGRPIAEQDASLKFDDPHAPAAMVMGERICEGAAFYELANENVGRVMCGYTGTPAFALLEALTAKLGKPLRHKVDTVQNGYGAKAQRDTYIWKSGHLVITLQTPSDAALGKLQLYEANYRLMEETEKRAYDAGQESIDKYYGHRHERLDGLHAAKVASSNNAVLDIQTMDYAENVKAQGNAAVEKLKSNF
ncbi:MAG TPA: hypothetical protein VMG82_30610 [Candidatus Sulfotelmatobacter sp.]|nr:hypothetical protein [Candidatus Sulfotelmatobacter sp.]